MVLMFVLNKVQNLDKQHKQTNPSNSGFSMGIVKVFFVNDLGSTNLVSLHVNLR